MQQLDAKFIHYSAFNATKKTHKLEMLYLSGDSWHITAPANFCKGQTE